MRFRAGFWAGVITLTSLGLSGQPPTGELYTVAKVRQLVTELGQPLHCRVRIQVSMVPGLLVSGPGDFYAQDDTAGISVLTGAPVKFASGEWVELEGWAKTGDEGEVELRVARSLSLGVGRAIRPRIVGLRDALGRKYEGQLIQVRGEVLQTSVGESRDTVVLGGGEPGTELRAYLRRASGQSSVFTSLAAPGAVVEITGISLPLNGSAHQIRLRSSADLTQIKAPPWIRPSWAISIAMILLMMGGAAFLWIASLKQAVARQTAEIRHLMTKAQDSARLKSEFVANMSHEIRTPMNAILGLTELTLATDLTRDQRENLENVRNATSSLLGVVNDVLDFARIEEGKLPFREENFDLNSLLRETMQQLSLTARQKGLDLSWNLDPEIPRLVRSDPYRLRQILVNLVSNAIKFTPSGSIRVEGAKESLAQKTAIVLFSVADTGVGIDLDDQARIFDAFAQVDGSLTRQQGGAGLGLSICARLVELFHGQIWVDSLPGKGSTFNFTAQFTIPDEALEVAQDKHLGAAPGGSAAVSLRVLVAEDNEMNRRLVVRLLEKEGHQVSVAVDGQEALTLACTEPFDLILMDIQMPVMSGLDACAALRAQGSGTPVVAITAHALPEFKERCAAVGMNDYLAKPIHSEELYAMIRKHVARLAVSAKNA